MLYEVGEEGLEEEGLEEAKEMSKSALSEDEEELDAVRDRRISTHGFDICTSR